MYIKKKSVYSNHALERARQRNININRDLKIENVLNMPIYKKDRGCIMYLDIASNIVYYVRDNSIETLIKTNPIQMLRYYLIGKGEEEKFNSYCRDNLFGKCNYGCKCKFKHINICIEK